MDRKDLLEDGEILTGDEWQSLWDVIATVRDSGPRVFNDVSTDEIVGVVEKWLGDNGFGQ